MSEGGSWADWGEVEVDSRRESCVGYTDLGIRALGGICGDIDGLCGCLVLSHGLIAVLKAVREGRDKGVTRVVDVRFARRVGLEAIRVAIGYLTTECAYGGYGVGYELGRDGM